MTIKAGVVGAAGFAGIEVLRLLSAHPDIECVCAMADSHAGQPVAQVYPALTGATDLTFAPLDPNALVEASCDLVFLAVPHTASLDLTPQLISRGITVIDLSADFRLQDISVYECWYGVPHTQPELLEQAVFGIPELFGAALSQAAERYAAGEAVLIACAGCYPTATALAAAPALSAGMVDPQVPMVVDALSGVTGAGKKATDRTHFCFANESAEAYSVASHRHTPEIEQILQLSNRCIFTPHLVPLSRGLLSTVYLSCAPEKPLPSRDELLSFYQEFYKDCSFVQVLSDAMPRTASVAGTNNAQLGAAIDERTRTIIALAAIDNLGKGAAGQALQCANIVLGLDERRGLEQRARAI